MILLFTDFSHADPYIGQMHRVLAQLDPAIRVIDLFHSAPVFNPKASAYLLAAYCPPVDDAVYCCVVDPGVGGDRAAVLVDVEGCRYVGPDNGLFEILLRQFPGKVARITWRPRKLSASFHGRDLFAPVAARLVRGQQVDAVPYEPKAYADWPDDLDEVVYIDHYGNIVTGRRADTVDSGTKIYINGNSVGTATTFSDMPEGGLFWYRNANGLVEIAANRASARDLLEIAPGSPIELELKK